MKFYSTKNKLVAYDLRDAVIKGLPEDKGLFMPGDIPLLPQSFFENIHSKSLPEIAFEVAAAFLKEDIPKAEIHRMVSEAINFEAPLVRLSGNLRILELFHGPTLAFKDFGARFMARLMSYLIKDSKERITVLVATSGDTGSAVANGFYGVEGIDVVLLYPSGKVSRLQEQQLTTLEGNITALEITGTFDDCQRMVKEAFTDPGLSIRRNLTSANSINISRLIPQSFYYFHAYARLDGRKPVVFSVPSGNFGNLTAGLIARRMGLPVKKFVASTNANRVFSEYLKSGNFHPAASVQTISNAMDVGNPSNFERMLYLYGRSVDEMRKDIAGYSFSDEETRGMMRKVYSEDGYILDPHGAVGVLGLKKYAEECEEDSYGVVLETAHPAKFKEVVEEVLSIRLELPEPLAVAAAGKKNAVLMKNDFRELKEFLMK